MSLFVLSCKDGWVSIMYDGLDAVGVDQQVRTHTQTQRKRKRVGVGIKRTIRKTLTVHAVYIVFDCFGSDSGIV